MKGPSMHNGTSGHKDALKLNFSMDKTSLADGRAGSSALQYKTPAKAKTEEDKIKWGKETKTGETTTRNNKGGKDTKTTYETKGTSKGKKVEKFAKTPEEIAKWKAAPEKNKEKYRDKTHTKTRSESSSTEGKKLETTPRITPKKVNVKTSETKPIEAKETREQKRTRVKKEREDRRSYTTVSDRSTFKRKVIKDKETGEERKVGKSGFGRAVENVTSKLTPRTRVKRRRVGKGKKRGGTSCSF